MEIILLILLFGLISWSAWYDTAIIGCVGIVLYLAGSWLFGDLSHLAFLLDPFNFVALLVLSLACGAAWSLWKWHVHVRSDRVQAALKKTKKQYDKAAHDNTQVIEEKFKDSYYFPDEARASQNVDRIVTWIIFWPFSMVIYFFDDFLYRIGKWVYHRLGRVYIRITEAALPDDMK